MKRGRLRLGKGGKNRSRVQRRKREELSSGRGGRCGGEGVGVLGGRMVVMAVLIEQRVDLRRKFHLLQTVLKTFVFFLVI